MCLTEEYARIMNTTKEIIQMTIAELRRNNMIRISQTNVFQKTEKILYMYTDIYDVEDPFLVNLEKALNKIKDDPDFEIIEMKYFQKMTHEEIAELIDVDPKTVTRRKNKIVKRLSFILFPSEAIGELLND